ncbi:hypothetical protein [Neobacillus jeddahensis]|uniref:hypothetical protein n=1 Tax=Neobacillus jeddahensis TaxID=1461580 RepID=UPI00058BC87E|nr:hypothetical protein [Neobacillus jeddahensis]
MKSIKTKIVTGVVTVGLLSGVGAAFAATDAGTQLQNWYNGQFGRSAVTIQNGVVNHVAGKVGALQAEYNGVKGNVTNQINGERDAQVTASTSEINAAKSKYIDQVTAKKATLSNGMAAQFDDISAFANSVINQAGVVAQNYANDELTKLAKDKGDAAITSVNTQLTAAQTKAKGELETAITNAKHDLTVQLAGETQATTQEINNAIDAKIGELRTLITNKAQELVDAQKTLIQNKADELESAAKTELDNVVKGI